MTTRATVTINSTADRDQISRWAQKVELGTIVEFRKKTRSHEQNAKLHAMLSEVADQVIWYGSKLKVEDWKNMFSASMRKAQVVPGIDPGTVVPLGIHTSTMTVDEMSNMIEAIYAFGAEHGVVFKEPKEQSNSGPTPSGPDTADSGALSASAASDDAPSSPSSDAPLSDFALRKHLMEFALKAFTTLADRDLDDATKSDIIEEMTASYKADVIHKSQWAKLSSVTIAFKAVFAGKRTIDEARSYVALDVLDCTLAELGGAE